MKERIFSKGLVVGVILLFIGISVQPALAINTISSDNEEDCSICLKVGKLQDVRLKRLLDRFETLNTNGWFFGKIPLCLFLWFMVWLAMMFFFLTNDIELLDYFMDAYYDEYDCDESLF